MKLTKLGAGLIVSLSILATSLIVSPGIASAAVAAGCDKSAGFLSLPTWYEYLEVGPKTDSKGNTDECAILGPNDTNGNFDWQAVSGLIALAILEILLRLSGLIAIGMVVYGGIRFISSQGESENAKAARNTIINAVIGLAIVLSASVLVNFLGRTLSP